MVVHAEGRESRTIKSDDVPPNVYMMQCVDRVNIQLRKRPQPIFAAVVQLPKVVNISLDFSAAPNVVST